MEGPHVLSRRQMGGHPVVTLAACEREENITGELAEALGLCDEVIKSQPCHNCHHNTEWSDSNPYPIPSLTSLVSPTPI